MYDRESHMENDENDILPLELQVGISPEKQLSRTINITALLCFLFIVFFIGKASVFPYTESLLGRVLGTEHPSYRALLDVYNMFEYALGFLLPLAVVLLIFRNAIYRPYIPFAPRTPAHAISAIFAVASVLYVFGALTNLFCDFCGEIGLPIVYYERALPDSPERILLYFISSVILPAFLEEMIFRGYILHLLLPFGKTYAILVSAVLFGTMHLYLPQILYATVAGVLIGYFVVRTQSIWIGILIHCTNNLISFLFDMAYLFIPAPYDTYVCTLLELGVLIAGIVGALILCYHNAHADPTPQLEANAVYSRTIDTRTVWRRTLTVPMILYFICAAYYTIINSFML